MSTPSLKPFLSQVTQVPLSNSALAAPSYKPISGLNPESVNNTLIPQFFGLAPNSNSASVNPQVIEISTSF
jgi:hypothetical protein